MLKIIFIACCLFHHAVLRPQLTLAKAIEQMKNGSFSTQLSKNYYQLALLDYTGFKAGLKPSISFYGNVPVYNKDNYAVVQPDGTIKFLRRSQNYSNVGIGFSQPIPFTGGSLAVNTDLYRFDDFVAKTKQYNGAPVFVRLSQPLFRYNLYRRDRQLAPVKAILLQWVGVISYSVSLLQKSRDVFICEMVFKSSSRWA